MPKTLAEFQEIKYNKKEDYLLLQEKVNNKPLDDAESKKVEVFKQALANGEINTKIRKQKQDEHIPGTKARERRLETDKNNNSTPSSEFKEGIDVKKLVTESVGKGELVFRKKHTYPNEFVTCKHTIGYAWNTGKQKYVSTRRLQITYSNKGIHAFPVKKLREEK